MRLMTPNAKLYGPLLEDIAEARGIDTSGVDLYISTRIRFPEMVGGSIRLPVLEIPQMIPSFLHELQHARDLLDDQDFGYEETERRARIAENIDPGTEMAMVRKHFPGSEIDVSDYHRDVAGLRSQFMGRGWHRESYRHALAARGIRSRAIPNPIASPELYDEEWYRRKGSPRSFVGSGLEGFKPYDVVYELLRFLRVADGTINYEGDEDFNVDLPDYYEGMCGLTRSFSNLPYEVFESYFDCDERFLEVEAIYLTGSRVTGFYTDESDVDVYIQFKRRPEIEERYGVDFERLVEKLHESTNNILYFNEVEEMLVRDKMTGKDVKVDVTMLSMDPPSVPSIKIWEGTVW